MYSLNDNFEFDNEFVVEKCKQYAKEGKHITSKDIENDSFIGGILQMTKFISLPDD